MSARVVIVGASAAGISTAEALQNLVPDREVVLVGQEPAIAHDRPPMSKQVLEGIWSADRAELLPESRRTKLTATTLLGRAAVSVNLGRRELVTDDGATLPFDDLVIATGVRPRLLFNEKPPGVHVVRDLADSQALRTALLKRQDFPLVIIGGGFIGLEVAATARKLGVAVTVIEPFPDGLKSRLGWPTTDRLRHLHVRNGVDLRFNIGVAAYQLDCNEHVAGLTLTDGTTIETRTVVVAVGCTPNIEWLTATSLDLANGVKCDEYCRAADNVWAAGDVARWFHAGLGRHIRLEHRLNASEQGAAVAANIVGPLKPYRPVPFFWTDQYDVRLQLAGTIEAGAEEHIEHLGTNSFLHTFRVGGQLIGVLGWNAAKAMMPLRRELAAAQQPVALAG